MLRKIGVVVVAILAVLGGMAMTGWTSMGTKAQGKRLERMQASPRWDDGSFQNTLDRVEPKVSEFMPEWFFGKSDDASPDGPVPIVTRTRESLQGSPPLGVTWFGHSTMFVDIDGAKLLIDPIWGDRASPFTWIGPQRFHRPILPLTELPEFDAVVISHDHYDHLDYPTIVELGSNTDAKFVVPLGIGAHLEYWGIAPSRIVELDWWDEHRIGDVRLVATPARHFSGRGLERDYTLWAGWAFIGPKHRAFYSGDTAMFPGFAEIGERLGPFDVTMMESGAYNQMWADVHLGPEQAVQAHQMVRGKVMIPVHWGTFDLALHSWTEPAERVLAAGERLGAAIATPKIGETVIPGVTPTGVRWWPETSWETAEDAPVVSSGLGELALNP